MIKRIWPSRLNEVTLQNHAEKLQDYLKDAYYLLKITSVQDSFSFKIL